MMSEYPLNTVSFSEAPLARSQIPLSLSSARVAPLSLVKVYLVTILLRFVRPRVYSVYSGPATIVRLSGARRAPELRPDRPLCASGVSLSGLGQLSGTGQAGPGKVEIVRIQRVRKETIRFIYI